MTQKEERFYCTIMGALIGLWPGLLVLILNDYIR